MSRQPEWDDLGIGRAFWSCVAGLFVLVRIAAAILVVAAILVWALRTLGVLS